MPFKVFFSYAHRDEPLLQSLKEHLAPLKNQGLVDRLWYDRDISAGSEWEPEVVRNLEMADIILLLVSPAFMNSDYCYGKELQRAIQRHERKEARVVPIILSPVDWQIPPLDKLQALPTDARPVTGAGWHSVDEALLNVVKGLRLVIKDLQKRPLSNPYQYQTNYIRKRMSQGISPFDALRECDPDLGRLIDEIVRTEFVTDGTALRKAVEKLLQEISAAGDNDLRVLAEVTPDALGVVADTFNYIIEEFAKVIARTRSMNVQISNATSVTLDKLAKQAERANDLEKFLSSSSQKALSSKALLNYIRELQTSLTEFGMILSYLSELSTLLSASISHYRLPERPNIEN